MKCVMNMTKATIVALVMNSMGVDQLAMAQQGMNNLWTGGYTGSGGPEEPWGGTNLDFFSGIRSISTVDRNMNYFRTVANITDSAGNLLLSTNGVRIGDATGNTMQNGDSLNPSWYTSDMSQPPFPDGLEIPQGCLILPKPGSGNIYYLLHGTMDDPSTTTMRYLYLTIVDMTLNQGLGAVVAKNQVLIDDTMNLGGINAVRHANGRDWWVVCHKQNTDAYFRLLVTPDGVAVSGLQHAGVVRTIDYGPGCFTPSGDKFAYYFGLGAGLELFHFDRCTGLFANAAQLPMDEIRGMGVAFSPNGRFLYVSAEQNVYQFDTEAENIGNSKVHIAHWDSTYSPSPPFATMFDMAQLAPDGKIYISTGNSTLRMHVIHEPDQPGLACNMEQHGVVLPRYYVNSLPNHPNYHLGAVAGSVCDSLGLGVGIAPLSLGEGPGVRAFPNPSDGRFMLGYAAHAGVGWLEVRNLVGQVVLRERIPQWSTVHAVALEGEAAGMYQCSLRWGMETMTTRVVIAGR